MTIITYVDEQALDYFAWSGRLMSLHAMLHRYDYWVFCSTHAPRGFVPQEDARWEKVHFLQRVLSLPAVSDSSTVAWVDADLIFIDPSLSLTQLMRSHPFYEVVLSAEIHGGTGVANTGCILVRVSAWSRALIAAWWDVDRLVGHDQIGFSVLYKQLPETDTQQVLIAPAHWLNSIPPAYLHQQVGHQVLHLMGERNDLRQRLFSMALANVCDVLRQHGDVPAAMAAMSGGQLGLTLPVLRAETTAVLRARQLALVGALGIWIRSSLQAVTSTVTELREIVLVLQRLRGEGGAGVLLHCYQALQAKVLADPYLAAILAEVKWCALCDSSDANSAIEAPIELRTQALHLLALLGNDLLHGVTEERLIESLFHDVALYLQCLLSLVAPSSRRLIVENGAMLLEARARWLMAQAPYTREDRVQRAATSFREAIRLMKEEISAESRNDFHLVSPLMGLAVLLCDHSLDRSFWKEGLALWEEAGELLEQLLSAEQQYKAEHDQLRQVLVGRERCGVAFDPSYRCCTEQKARLDQLQVRSGAPVATLKGAATAKPVSGTRKFRKRETRFPPGR